jgi:hypothetical protein
MAGPDQRVTMNDRENCQPWCTPIAHVRSISVGRTRGRSQVTQGRPMVAVSSSRTGHGSSKSKGASWCVTPAVFKLARRLMVN